jgi:hypothetical protein
MDKPVYDKSIEELAKLVYWKEDKIQYLVDSGALPCYTDVWGKRWTDSETYYYFATQPLTYRDKNLAEYYNQ